MVPKCINLMTEAATIMSVVSSVALMWPLIAVVCPPLVTGPRNSGCH